MAGNGDDLLVVPKDFDDQLVQLVKDSPALYNSSHGDFKCSIRKEEIWVTISTFLGVPMDYCTQRWRTIRERYVKKKKLVEDGLENGARTVDQWPLFAALDFLDPYVIHRSKRYSQNHKVEKDCQNIKVETDLNPSHFITNGDVEDSGSDLNLQHFMTVHSPTAPTGTVTIQPETNSIQTPQNDLVKQKEMATKQTLKQTLSFKKKQKPKRLQNNNHNVNNIEDINLASVLKAMASTKQQEVEDEEEYFGKIVASTLRRLPPRQRAQTKLVIYQILVDTEFPAHPPANNIDMSSEGSPNFSFQNSLDEGNHS